MGSLTPPSELEMQSGPQWELTPDGAKLRVTIPTTPVASVFEMEAAEVDDFIANLALMREGMSEPVTPRLEPVARLRVIPDPAWKVTASEHGPVLSLRHPGLGWLGFVVPPHEATHMAAWLNRVATDKSTA